MRAQEDIPAIKDLMGKVYRPPLHGPEAIWSEQNLLLHISRFPDGQFVAVDKNGRLVGTSTTLRTSMKVALTPHTWSEISGRGSLSTHDPGGTALYGVNIAVDPSLFGQGIASALYKARFALGQKLECQAFIAGARIPGFSALAGQLTPKEYLKKVVAGELFDPTLSKQIKMGFKVCALLENYSPDPETLNYAALISMELTNAPKSPNSHPKSPSTDL
ncbi:MAG: GNAT family N-acetyltransferase [Holophagaceae bacterium]|nr:GNAT family N-acetyltransferase [Holophagaceae bacterium]